MNKVAELEGAELDLWVARAGEVWTWAHVLHPTMTLDPTFSGVEMGVWPRGEYGALIATAILIPRNPFRQDRMPFCPSIDWRIGGMLIERERIWLSEQTDAGTHFWEASTPTDDWSVRHIALGPTPLTAAMRAFVASKYGDTVPEDGAHRYRGITPA